MGKCAVQLVCNNQGCTAAGRLQPGGGLLQAAAGSADVTDAKKTGNMAWGLLIIHLHFTWCVQRSNKSGSGSGGSGSGRRGGLDRAAWALACSSDNALLVAHMELLRLTGCINKARCCGHLRPHSTCQRQRSCTPIPHSGAALQAWCLSDALQDGPPSLQQQQHQLQQQGVQLLGST
jgi:hypothetical protein